MRYSTVGWDLGNPQLLIPAYRSVLLVFPLNPQLLIPAYSLCVVSLSWSSFHSQFIILIIRRPIGQLQIQSPLPANVPCQGSH